jgi:ABC-type phosphate transport system auxiliary subunit
MTSLGLLARIREDLEEIRDHINTILTRDDLRIIDYELEAMLKTVNLMIEGKIRKPRRKTIIRIRHRIEAIQEELDSLREEVRLLREKLEEMMTGEIR